MGVNLESPPGIAVRPLFQHLWHCRDLTCVSLCRCGVGSKYDNSQRSDQREGGRGGPPVCLLQQLQPGPAGHQVAAQEGEVRDRRPVDRHRHHRDPEA